MPNLYKKKFVLILQLHYAPLVSQKHQKILLSDPRWRTWLLSHAHFYRGKIDEFRLKRLSVVNSKLRRFRIVQLVWIESAEDFN